MLFRILFLHLLCFSQLNALPLTEAKRIPSVQNFFGIDVIDDYAWMENADDYETKGWSLAQTEQTQKLFADLPHTYPIYSRLKKLLVAQEVGLIKLTNGYYLLLYKNEFESHPTLFKWKPGFFSQELKQILNPNLWPVGDSLTFLQPSPNGRYLAYGRQRGGDESPSIHVIDLQKIKDIPVHLEGHTHRCMAWIPDSKSFLYSTHANNPEENYWEKIHHHWIDSAPNQKDRLVYEDTNVKDWFITGIACSLAGNDEWFVDIGRFRFANTVQVLRKPLKNLYGPAEIIFDNEGAHLDLKEIGGERYLITDLRHQNREVLKYNAKKGIWDSFIPPEEGKIVRDLVGCDHKFFVTYQVQGHQELTVFSKGGKKPKEIPLPGIGEVYVVGDWSKSTVYVAFSSLAQPLAVYKYRSSSNSLSYIAAQEFPGYLSTNYMVDERLVTSKDGTRVPMLFVHKKSLHQNGSHPTLLTAYGGFGVNFPVQFNPSYIPWLEHGGVVAVALIRGGGELGKGWHETGKRLHKQNSFDDFIAAAEALIDLRITSPSKLAIQGGSNGGLLVGAAMVQRPDLFAAVACEVPLLDMVNFHRFKIGELWKDEYGDVGNPHEFANLLKISPYHNVEDGVSYPSVLLYGGANDSRVDIMHVRKMAAKMQAANPLGTVLLNINPNAGHGYGTDMKEISRVLAQHTGFLLSELGAAPLNIRAPEREERSIESWLENNSSEQVLEERSLLKEIKDEINRRKMFSPQIMNIP